MNTPDQELERRANPEMPDCANCGHDAHAGECEYEPGDTLSHSEALPPCGCRNYEMEER